MSQIAEESDSMNSNTSIVLALLLLFTQIVEAEQPASDFHKRLLLANNSAAASFGTNSVNRYIVRLQTDADQEQFAADQNVSRDHKFRRVFNGFSARLTEASVAKVKSDPRVIAVIYDRIVATNQDQVIPTGIRRMGVDIFPPVKIDGTDKRVNVDVAVIDSGVQTNHPDLNVVQAVNVISGGDGQLVDPNDPHGTECAGVVGAFDNNFGVVGVAPGARIWSVRHSTGGTSYASDTTAAFEYVLSHADQISVCSCSFGTFYGQDNYSVDYFWHPLIQALVNHGVVVVAAAGNAAADIAGPNGILDDWSDTDDLLPAAYPEVMAVTAIDPMADQFSPFSNFCASKHSPSYVNSPGGAIDVAAPGMGAATTIPGSSYEGDFTGTSAACPHVAGLVAIYIATHGRATNAAGVYAIRQAIVDAALPQEQWLNSNTLDHDTNHEGLAVASLTWAANAPEMLSIVKASSDVQVGFSTAVGYVHTVQFASSVQSGAIWSNLISEDGTGSNSVAFDSALTTNRFYRLASKPMLWPKPESLVATNIGGIGALGNASYYYVTHGVPGPVVGDPNDSAIGFAPYFSGSRVQIPFNQQLNTNGPFSIEFWIRPGQTASGAEVMDSSRYDLLGPGSFRAYGWRFWQASLNHGDGNGFWLQCYTTSANFSYALVSTEINLDTNAWYLVDGVFDGANLVLYVNGSNVGSVPMASERPNPSNPTIIGGTGGAADLDEIALYSYGLTAPQIMAHYQTATNFAPSVPYSQVILNDMPVGYWRFNEHP